MGGNQIQKVHLHCFFLPKSQDLYSYKVVLVCILRSLLVKSPCEGRMAFSGPADAIAYGPHT